MKILVAPDKFKGSISATVAAEAIARGWLSVFPEAEMQAAPIADGGEGFAASLGTALGGEWISVAARDPLGREVAARYAWVAAERLAVIEMSEASGYWRLTAQERDPLRANTYGTGQLMRDAVQRGARRILVGLGGSATTDGGVGMAAALGYELRDGAGDALEPVPGRLSALNQIGSENALALPEVIAACDVKNPLLGQRGTARVFSPQKGADPGTVEVLEAAMARLADVVTRDLGCDFRHADGAGAAGGIGFGLMSFCGARVRSGFEVVAEVLQLERRIAECDLVITGEGGLDEQTLEGKGPAGVAALARRQGRRVLAFAGAMTAEAESLFDAALPIVDQLVTLETAMARGAEYLERAAGRAARLYRLGQPL